MSGETLMKKDFSEYKVPAQDHISISLAVAPKTDANSSSNPPAFPPEFAHQHFGDNEEIFGYSSPSASIEYTSGGLDVLLSFAHDGRMPSDDLEADDVLGKIRERLCWAPLETRSALDAALKAEEDFRPPGDVVHEYSRQTEGPERRFATYKVGRDEPLTARVQSFAFWFIDAASYTDPDDEKWTFYITYEKVKMDGMDRFVFVGYAAVYLYYAYPQHLRPRIGQILVLPPFRRNGHGVTLLQTLYKDLVPNPKVIDITVEDPSDNFVAMRDLVDASNASALASFAPSALLEAFSPAMEAEARQRLKLDKAQARRVYEILRLKAVGADAGAARAFRLAVKQRLNVPFQRSKREEAKVAAAMEKERTLKLVESIAKGGGGDVAGSSAALEDEESPRKAAEEEKRMAYLQSEFEALRESYARTLERLATYSFAPPTLNGLKE